VNAIERIYRNEAPQVLATLIRLLGGFELAEEALQMAFLAATQQWPIDGLPKNPRTWLVSTGRFRAIDLLRRRKRFSAIATDFAYLLEQAPDPEPIEDASMPDDILRLIFICCHPALPADAQTALCLREVCGLTTEAIAAAFLVRPTAIAQRIVRAKLRIREAGLPYEVPDGTDADERLETVLRVIYLVFSEGYSASAGDSLQRADMCIEAIRLARLLQARMDNPDIDGLIGLMRIQQARSASRTDANGDIVLLADQDRSLWDRDATNEGLSLIDEALRRPPFSSYTLQGAIAAQHAKVTSADNTDWASIVRLYDLLLISDPGPIVELNRAIAVGMRDGPQAGLQLIDPLAAGPLSGYRYAHLAAADFFRRSGSDDRARQSYVKALGLEPLPAERRFIEKRLAELTSSGAA
jgi:RNA polymerase sigma-70 factor (ECF subfamily)